MHMKNYEMDAFFLQQKLFRFQIGFKTCWCGNEQFFF